MVLVGQRGWNGEVDAEPVCRPTGTERFANLCGTEVVRGCIFEGGTREVWRRVDFKLDVRLARGAFGFNLAGQLLVSGYSSRE